MRLIDADALEKAFALLMWREHNPYDTVKVCDIVNQTLDLIDNAPTVETERSQGEWISREDMDYVDKNKVVHNHFQCNKCGFIHDFIDGHTSQYNFCPNCGTKMEER